MEIDSMDESIYMGPKDPHVSVIMKGKRTKRPRQPSPASAVFTASSCSSDAGGGGGGRGGGRMHSKIRSSESLCSEISTTTEEDEDMANCLILLAQSGRRNSINTTIQIKSNVEKQEEGDDEMMKLDKYSVRKVKEMTIKTSSTIVGKAKIYVYECKTCNRCFPSFQALGGHRTSHKKQNDDDHHEEKGKKFPKISPSSLLSLELAKKNSHGSNIIIDNNNNNNSKAKIHECSICGAEFASGQALGGHMRRHRSPPARATTPASGSSHDQGGERPRNVMELDLNLPAPPEDGGHHQFRLSLFSSPALVDC